jgi:hypothetical protein
MGRAALDVRKACNVIKRTSNVYAAAIVSGIDPSATMQTMESMSLQILENIGFDTNDPERIKAVLPMMVEAVSTYVGALVSSMSPAIADKISQKEMNEMIRSGIGIISDVAKSRVLSNMIEPVWMPDVNAIAALRMTSSAAMANVAVEFLTFDFGHTPAECMKEASKFVVKAATDACNLMAPKETPSSSRLTLSQSLLSSAAKIYAASWRAEGKYLMATIDAMPYDEAEMTLDRMQSASLKDLLKPVNSRFNEVFGSVVRASFEMFASTEEDEAHEQVANCLSNDSRAKDLQQKRIARRLRQ